MKREIENRCGREERRKEQGKGVREKKRGVQDKRGGAPA
jgi:hypothetical protein